MRFPRIRQVRASVLRGGAGGADYHDQPGAHWIDDHIATPMARYPEYRQSRKSFGINVLGTLVVEIEADNGVAGFAAANRRSSSSSVTSRASWKGGTPARSRRSGTRCISRPSTTGGKAWW